MITPLPSGQKFKLFFVEDDVLMLRMYQKFFTQEGFDVSIAINGAEAISELAKMQKLPDLIILDVMMPELNGIEVLKILKENPNYKTIPVIIWSNLSREGDIEKALSMGAVLYLIKSEYTPQEVIAKIKEFIQAYKKKNGVPEVKIPTRAKTL
jgi:two-component system alkaline phosphatase synthesis response regulator PhoP